MKLPDKVQDHLHNWILAARHPFCMRVAADNRVLEAWGPATDYGFDDLQVGENVSDLAPFLDDYPLEEEVQLPFVTGASGTPCHIHLLPDPAGRYVLYMDAREEFLARRRAQQTANEVRLLMDQQQRLINDLVDAKAELTVRRREAEDESRRRGEYIATMSHEFRTPLASILAQTEQLTGDSSKAVAQTGQAIDRVTQQLLWLIDNLLLRARLDSGGFAIHATVTDVRRLADDLSLVFAPLAADKTLSFAVRVADTVPDFVLADDLHLRQVLVNLLANAVKYTDTGSVALEFDWQRDELRAIVVDTGAGIPTDEQARLVEPFQRGRNAPRVLGAGLGLSITSQLINAMAGRLDIASVPGAGTRINVTVPAAAAAAQLAANNNEPQQVLLGEDDPDIADLLVLKLGEAGYGVQAVNDGAAVVEAALARRPDIIILDTNMPKLDGPAAARQLREQGIQTPIVALSAAHERADIDYALSSGCSEFMRKPPHIPSLLRLLQQLTLHQQVDAGSPQGKQM